MGIKYNSNLFEMKYDFSRIIILERFVFVFDTFHAKLNICKTSLNIYAID